MRVTKLPELIISGFKHTVTQSPVHAVFEQWNSLIGLFVGVKRMQLKSSVRAWERIDEKNY